MDNPPTVSSAAIRDGSIIASAVKVSPITDEATGTLNTDAFAFRGGPWTQRAPSWPNSVMAYPQPLTADEGGNAPYVEFLYYGQQFEFGYKGQGLITSRVWVDGRPAENFYTADTTTDGAFHWRTVTFTAPGWRRIRLDLTMSGFAGLWIGPGDAVAAVVSTGDRLLVIHDSYGEGAGADTSFLGYAPLVGAMLGFDDTIVLSEGSTGVLAANAGLGRPKYADRAADWPAARATHVLLGMSINDDQFTASQVAAALGPLLDTIKALPTAPQVWVMGPAPRGGDPSEVADKRARDAAYRPVAQTRGALYVSLVSPASMWTPTNNGALMWTDGAHPSNAGHEGIARTFVSRLLLQLAA